MTVRLFCLALLTFALDARYALADEPDAAAEPAAPRSGYAWLGPELRALQDDDFANPGMLWVDRGEALWQTPAGSGASCADCHGEPASLVGVAARMPRWDDALGGLENLEMQINACRAEHQNAPPWPWESEPLLAMTALVASTSRGLPLEPDVSGPAAAALRAGRREYERRRGQLDLSCRNCHEQNAGRRLRGDVVSEGMINGFPIYRLTWQTLGSRHRMFRWCNEAVGSEPHAWGADEYLALELYLAWRGRGLPVETPAVRR
ncbi:MAG: sulfur oxidation c-type cytochrome SoxA [Pseudomonadales bacterium]|nr:sulfur oxidation c-type cytochrome SoxA [Pseudomonadales bacterium]